MTPSPSLLTVLLAVVHVTPGYAASGLLLYDINFISMVPFEECLQVDLYSRSITHAVWMTQNGRVVLSHGPRLTWLAYLANFARFVFI